MINKLNIILCLVLCAAVMSAANYVSAQSGSDKVLVAGKQTLRQSHVDKVIEFYEWALKSRFSDNERERFQELYVEDFRRDEATTYKNGDTIIKTLQQINAKDEESKEKTRSAFNEGFVKDLRTTDDEASRMLLAIYERGQGSEAASAETPASEEPTSAKSSSGAGAGKLVGKWMRSGGAGGLRINGETRYNSSNDVIFEFYADGKMMFINDKQTLSILQCRTTEMTKIPGTYSVSGDTLTINLGAGTSVGTSSCEAKDNFKKNLNPDKLTKKFVVKNLESIFRPDAPLILCLDGAKDDECFERDPKS